MMRMNTHKTIYTYSLPEMSWQETIDHVALKMCLEISPDILIRTL